MSTYIRLTDYKDSASKEKGFFKPENRYEAKQEDFEKIPGSPIAYWISEQIFHAFSKFTPLGEIASPKIGMRTGNNERFLRLWYEVNEDSFQYPNSTGIAKKWIPYNKGGEFRKWYGNFEFVVNWENDGYEIKESTLEAYPQLSWDNLGWKISNEGFYFKKGVTWTDLSSSSFGVRILPEGFIFDAAGPALFGELPELYLAQMGSKVSFEFLKILNPTLHFKNYNIAALPTPETEKILQVKPLVTNLCKLSKTDWDFRETSWDFTSLPLLKIENRWHYALKDLYEKLRAYWQDMTIEMQQLEEENNRIFINAYSLQNELTPDVSLTEITLSCNPHYRYGGNKSEEELEALRLSDTIRELVSYGVGVMFGRYSLDQEGLVVANTGQEIPTDTSFPIDDDNVIPVLEDDYFSDDIASRFIEFVKVAFGEEHHAENIRFIEDSLGTTIRKYFVKGFYEDHIKRYKKRPIYWMVSSPKKSFNALIYMHRYQEDVFARVQNSYLREYLTKLETAMIDEQRKADDEANSATERKKAAKAVETITKKMDEIIKFDRDSLSKYAQRKEPIDLDDGVKVNYCKFKEILYPITGLCKK